MHSPLQVKRSFPKIYLCVKIQPNSIYIQKKRSKKKRLLRYFTMNTMQDPNDHLPVNKFPMILIELIQYIFH